MEPEKLKALRAKLAVLKTCVRNVATIGHSLDDNSTRDEYRQIYRDIEQTLGDPNLRTYAPPISGGITMGDGPLWPQHQAEIVNSATKLITYLDAILSSEATAEAPSSAEHVVAPAPVFISHGRKSPALDLVRDFITSLGLIPVIAMEQPSQGMSVDQKVTSYMKLCKCAIILATADDRIEGSCCFQPRQNVIHEIGLAQQIFPNRITYLLEENTEFPSNIAPKVYERFTKDNLTKAFIAIVRDLRAFGIL